MAELVQQPVISAVISTVQKTEGAIDSQFNEGK